MANKSFGVKELSVISANQTPTIESVTDIIVNANNVAISTNVTVGNRVGVGTTNPITSLDIRGNVYTSGIITASSFVGNLTGTATTAIGVSTTISINTSGIITASSFVGNVTGTATTANGVSTTISINTSGIITASAVNVGTGGTIITTSTNGSVGIGTTNPVGKLDVFGNVNVRSDFYIGQNIGQQLIISNSGQDISRPNGYIRLNGGTVYDSTRHSITLTNGTGIVIDGGSSETYGIEIKGGGGNTKITQGNLGIGTNNPTSKLHVIGDVRVGINTSQGIILTSANGTKYRLIVSDAGVLSTILVP